MHPIIAACVVARDARLEGRDEIADAILEAEGPNAAHTRCAVTVRMYHHGTEIVDARGRIWTTAWSTEPASALRRWLMRAERFTDWMPLELSRI
jgi:hypothetical protein